MVHPVYHFSIAELNKKDWQRRLKDVTAKFEFADDMFMRDNERVRDLRRVCKYIMTAGGVRDTRDHLAVGQCLQKYFLGGFRYTCPTCGRAHDSRVGYMGDPKGWENLDPPETLLSWIEGMADCNNHEHAIATMLNVMGVPFSYIVVAGGCRIKNNHFVPQWTHILIGIHTPYGVVPMETISPFRFGTMTPWEAVAVYNPRNKHLTMQLNPRWVPVLGWEDKRIPFSHNQLKLKVGGRQWTPRGRKR